jgi:hypothetical protein
MATPEGDSTASLQNVLFLILNDGQSPKIIQFEL